MSLTRKSRLQLIKLPVQSRVLTIGHYILYCCGPLGGKYQQGHTCIHGPAGTPNINSTAWSPALANRVSEEKGRLPRLKESSFRPHHREHTCIGGHTRANHHLHGENTISNHQQVTMI